MEQITKELVGINEISEYLPHEAPMLMIDCIYQCEGQEIITGFTVRPDNIFVKNGVLREPGIMENIAQSAAAKGGYNVKKLGEKPGLGFIGALSDLKIYFHPPVGEELITEIQVKNEVFNVSRIEGRMMCNSKLVAECEMKIIRAKTEIKD